MSESNPIATQIRKSPGIRIAVLFGLFFFMLCVTSLLILPLQSFSFGDERVHQLMNSTFQSLFVFCFPAILLAKFASPNPLKWLRITNSAPVKSYLGVLLVFAISMPAMEWLIEWNKALHLPDFLSSLESQLREWEEANDIVTQNILKANSWVSIFAGVCIIGILTGFAEEIFFRGAFQGILVRSSLGINLSVWAAAFIFSCMHFQFFGFLPRLLMGAFFGYLLVWTRSLWVPIFAHIFNNSIVVITAGITGNAEISFNQPPSNASHIIAILSFTLTTLFFFFFRHYFFAPLKINKVRWQKKRVQQATKN